MVTLEYDAGVPGEAGEKLEQLFSREEVTVEKKSKNGITQQNIIPMIRRLDIRTEEKEIRLEGLEELGK